MAKKVNNIEVELKETKILIVEISEKFKKMALDNNFVEEEYTVDMRYVNELEGLKIIVDKGAPMSIVSVAWLEKYLKEIEVDARDVEEKSCNRRFIFGEKVYKSHKEVIRLIIMKVGEGDYVRKNISVNVIDREEYLLLFLESGRLLYFMRRMVNI